jgi:predicted GIY-YIG superfamily endonuclease
MFYTYVLLCDNGAYYKGFTNNLEHRYQQHLNGNGAKYTTKHKPIKIAYYETFKTEEEAVAREKYFKSGSGREWLKSQIELQSGRTCLPPACRADRAGREDRLRAEA